MTATILDKLTTGQASRQLGVSPQHVRRLVREGRLPVLVTQLGFLLDPSEVEALRIERANRAPVGATSVAVS